MFKLVVVRHFFMDTSDNSQLTPWQEPMSPSHSGDDTEVIDVEEGPNIKCHCNKRVVIKVTKKQNENEGREFYSCGVKGKKRCDFFQWVESDEEWEKKKKGSCPEKKTIPTNGKSESTSPAKKRRRVAVSPETESSEDGSMMEFDSLNLAAVLHSMNDQLEFITERIIAVEGQLASLTKLETNRAKFSTPIPIGGSLVKASPISLSGTMKEKTTKKK